MNSDEQPIPAPEQSRKRTTRVLGRAGQQLGSYRLVRMLANGGFAEVYLGEHIHLNTHAAIKILHAQIGDEDLEQFRFEARIVARLRHPHIVSVLDFNVQQDTPFLVMDYAPNGNLRQRHFKHATVSPATIATYLTQISAALQYAHREHVIHRDIKPENMLVGWHNEILLSDFGIAVFERSTQSQAILNVIGTLTYMSPEQLEGKPRLASDQYSLAVVVYEWLCGECPFYGSMAEISAQHLNAAPPSLQARNPAVTPALEEVVFKALAKDPAQRYSDVQGFAQAFERAIDQQQLYLHTSRTDASNAIAPALTGDASLSPTVQAAPFDDLLAPTEVAAAVTLKPKAPRLGRRTFLFGLVGVTTMGLAGSGITWLAQQYLRGLPLHNSGTPLSSQSTPTPAATPVPVGTTLFTYFSHSDVVNTVAWSLPGGGTYIATGGDDRVIHVWFANSGSDARPTYTGHNDAVTMVAWSPDGMMLASASADKTVQVWKAFPGSSDTPFSYTGHSDVVNAVAWSFDGSRIASASNDNTVQLWHADGSNLATYSGHNDIVNTVAWSPDGTMLASGSNDKTVRVWKASDNSDIFTYPGHNDAVNAVAWSPNGKYIASASSDKTVQIWEATTGNSIFTYPGHNDVVNAVAWSPNGSRLASASNDKTVQLWNANGSSPFTYTNHSDAVKAVAWSPTGNMLASASADKTVQEWQAE
ncbi:MAG: protein kinase domain-containing protein [Ktedonobacteraceae bacterium]